MSAHRPLDALAVATMLALCAIWGFNQVAIKLASDSIPLLLQGAVRSLLATLLLLAWARSRRIPLFARDGTLAPGLAVGVLFAVEFALIYAGLAHTTASRMVVFVYLAPPLTALGLAKFVPGERLTRVQWLGVALAFAGIAFAFREGFSSSSGRATLAGDAAAIAAAALWAATTVMIRATGLARVSATKTLFYQLAVSAALLPIASIAFGERPTGTVSAIAIASVAYQVVVVAFASYLAWFWLLTRYLASRLSVFSFAAPLFGVAFGHLVLGESISTEFIVAALMLGAGIALVNLRRVRDDD